MRILVIEDDVDFGFVVVEHLNGLGHDAQHAINGPQALALIDTFTPELVLIDIQLPIFDGNNVAAAIHEHWEPRPRLVALTSRVDRADRSLFDACLPKPATVREVGHVLTDLLHS